ncbi:MAG TPA: hypothetical protein VHD39_02185 [Acidimicrobiales bacterium]|nr:hypothetical protein [Acidimicrobiales bacterium]
MGQLAILSLAIVFGVLGFAEHLLWLASLVLMGILWGTLAAARQGGLGAGVVADVVSAVVDEARDVADSASRGSEDRTDDR